METPRHDIEIRQGATFEIGFAYLDPDKTPINLTGFSARMQVRDRIGGKVLADASTGNGQITITPLEGKLVISIPPSVTRLMPAGKGVYDFFIYGVNDYALCLVEGDVDVRPSSTRA